MLPPLLPGLPLIGNMREFRRDPVRCIGDAHARLGPVFTLRLGPKRVVVMIGPDYHQLFFSETDRSLSTPEVYRFLTPMFGEVLGACPFAEYREQRRAIVPFFGKDCAARHIRIMATETQALVRSLGERGEFAMWELLEHLALTIAAKAVLGAEFWDRPAVDFHSLFRDIARGMDYILPPNLPLPRFLRRNRARKRLYGEIKPLIERRRQRLGSADDLCQHLAEATYSDGRLLPLDRVAGLMLIMIHGAYETVAAQACWCLIDLVNHPEVLQRVLAEQHAAWSEGEALDADVLKRLPLLRSAVQESMRLRPAATVVCRYAAAPLRVGRYTVPAGSLVMICPGVAHRLAAVFAQPDRYVAERFLQPSFHANGFITFGGGMHRCLGGEFAITEIMIVLTTLLAEFELSLATPHPAPDYRMTVTRPAPPCMVRYVARPRPSSREGARAVAVAAESR